jgi:hypothetical protein
MLLSRFDALATMDEPENKKDSPYRRAFFNQYNAILMGAAGLFALATFSWLPLVVGVGVEALWMTFVPDSKFFQRWLGTQKSREGQERIKRETEAILKQLDRGYVQRFNELQQVADEVLGLSKENQSLETRLVEDELKKIGQVLFSFLRMARSHQRLANFLAESRESEIKADIAECNSDLRQEKDPRVQASLKQALSLAEKRLRQHEQIANSAKALALQMETLEKALGYLKSHIVAIGSHEELASELDGLVMGVDSVESLEAETGEALDDLHQLASYRDKQVATKR